MRSFQRGIWFVLFAALALTACRVEGGIPAATPRTAPDGSPIQGATVERDIAELRIGLLSEPDDLLPYYDDPADQRRTAPISELLFPSPVLSVGYGYTTTGTLTKMPSFENGLMGFRLAPVYLDAAGTITTSVTEVMTQVQQLVITYTWNPDLAWSDGQPVTASDSVFAYDLARKAELGEQSRTRLAVLEHYDEVDAHTTRAILKPDVINPPTLAFAWTPLPRHAMGTIAPENVQSSDQARSPLSYGPYTVSGREVGIVRLTRNDAFHGSLPHAQQITFVVQDSAESLRTSVLRGSLDVAVLDSQIEPSLFDFLQNDSENNLLQVSYTPGAMWEHLDFNLDVPILQDIRVRRAIAAAIDRQGAIDALEGGQATVLDSWILPQQPYSAPSDQLTRYSYAPMTATRLLDEVGLVDSDNDGVREYNGEPLKLSLITTQNTPLREALAERIVADLRAISLSVELQKLPAAQLYAQDGPLYQRQFQLALFGWVASPALSGIDLWGCTFVPNAVNNWRGSNFAGWCFFEADQSIRRAMVSRDPEERRAAYLRHQQLLAQEIPVLPLFQRVIITLSRPGLEGLKPDPFAPITWNIAAWQRAATP